jgi:hypothetical protein
MYDTPYKVLLICLLRALTQDNINAYFEQAQVKQGNVCEKKAVSLFAVAEFQIL